MTSSADPRVLIVIPAYNEAAVIREVIEGIEGSGLNASFEILVVDDGSSDATCRVARAAGVRTVSLIRNLGYGYALQTGYRVASDEAYDIVVQMDGDGQHDPASIPGLLEPILRGEADVVVGSRALSPVFYPMPFARKLGQRLFSWILKGLCGLRIGDPTSGFQALSAPAVRLFLEDFPGDYPDADTLLYVHLNGMRVVEVPATFRVNPAGTSMHSGLAAPAYYIYKMTLSLVLTWVRHRGRPRQAARQAGESE